MFAKKRRKIWPIVLAFVLLLLGVLAAGGVYIARTLTFELLLRGNEMVTQEYGAIYADAGVQPVLRSPLFGDYVVEVPVVSEGQVDSNTVGIYAITYRAEFLWMADTAVRIVKIMDTTAPVISLVEDEDFTLPGHAYIEDGFTAVDDYDGDISHLVEWTLAGNVMTYRVADSSGNVTTVHRVIHYDDPLPPSITLLGDREVTVYLGREYLEAGWTAEDNFDGDMTEKVKAEGEVDIHTPGKYTITYTLTDTFGNSTSAKRVVTVEPVPEPEIVVPGEKVIYLTFDDGPGPHTPRLLEILKKYDVKATFFVVNTKYADLISDIVADGHAIGVHTASHIYRDIYASEEAFFADFKTIHDLIYEKSEVKTTLMRFPGGSSNRVSASYNEGIMTRLTKIVTDYGLQYFDWNVNSLDAGGAGTAEQVYQNVISSVRQNPYSVVLQHDIHGFSVDAVERIIQWGLANGYTFLPLEPTSPGCHQKILN
jgi:peptidoglycan/xylan/chitin deacetylase (PgdA/CDA1 family)